MSLRHLKSTLKSSCLLAATAVVAIASTATNLSRTLSDVVLSDTTESEVAFRASGRFDTNEVIMSYRASGRFEQGLDDTLLSYRGSERGIETLAYRASGRFSNGIALNPRSEEAKPEQTVAYRASGRFDSLLLSSRSSGRLTSALTAFELQPYRGSERGVEAVG